MNGRFPLAALAGAFLAGVAMIVPAPPRPP